MTPEDTTRLRADAEAVRDAGARVVQTRDPGGPAYWAAHHDLREAKRVLYAAAPPDGIILALLDEVERLRARVAVLEPPAGGQCQTAINVSYDGYAEQCPEEGACPTCVRCPSHCGCEPEEGGTR